MTEEVSLAGFSAPCAHAVEVGHRVDFVLHLPDEKELEGHAMTVRCGADGNAGFACHFNADGAAAWEALLAQEQVNGGVWRMVSRYVTGAGAEKEGGRAVLDRGSLRSRPDAASEEPVVMRLHMVGENGEAYRVAFEKYPSDRPEDAEAARANPKLLELTRRTVARMLREEVFLKRSPRAPVIHARLVELLRGGYGYVSVLASGQPSLVGLQGSELIGIEADGKPVFPFFDQADLDRIAMDTFRREVEPAPKPVSPAPALVSEERFSAAYAHKLVDARHPDAMTVAEVLDAMAVAERVQRRNYGGRWVRLFPDLWLEASRPGVRSAPVRGFAMHDGHAACLFVLSGPGAPCVVRLDEQDQIIAIRGGLKRG